MAEKTTFRQAMERLDEIVTKLNSTTLELEEAMKLFEEGLKLSRQCETQLKRFENKMNALMVDEGEKKDV